MEEEVVLCAASAYEQKFYLNPQFESLPEAVRQELQIMCVLYTEDFIRCGKHLHRNYRCPSFYKEIRQRAPVRT